MSKKHTAYIVAPFKVHPLVMSKWNSQLLNSTEAIFQDGCIEKKIDDINIQDLYQIIGQLEVEKDWLKKQNSSNEQKRFANEMLHSQPPKNGTTHFHAYRLRTSTRKPELR